MNNSFIVEGGHTLHGAITPQGAKNEALEVICATLLTADKVVVENIPNILDVNNLMAMLGELGTQITKLGDGKYEFQTKEINFEYLHSENFFRKSSSLRGSVLLLGPLVGRFGKAVLYKPGGDKIGRRRLDTHFFGLMQLGAKFNYIAEKSCYEITANNLTGNYMLLDEASVTGTANIVMASVLAKGKTTIYNAACGP